MAIRLALVGVALVAAGALDLGGFREITVAAGGLALVASGISWLVARRGGTS
ncbi:hypothetical protein [Actinomadura montaniterrae]|uniref:hypothetical protein n=1 Tax=Actinomadura montaniterrae TaxID=1803903 RepID=UPI00178C7570|nr:hypothetical protein [Actinomadura montaniterrae]